jgi:UDP-N-acetylglucosamine 4,6-dehydratase
MIVKGKKYLITGGTGVIGYSLCKRIISMGGHVIVLSRSETKLNKLKEKYNEIEIVVGDICDKQLVRNTIKKVDGVFHLAAVAEGMQTGKPIESIKTNIIGSLNVLEESSNVDFVLGISSDKVVQVSGNYGATKFLMEKLFNQFEETNPKVKYRVVRLGNIIYSVDSVLCKWKKLIKGCEEVIVTDKRATRFFMTSEESVDSILNCLENAKDSKPYFEPMKSTSIGNLLQAMINKYSPDGCELPIKTIGLQPNENLHEKISSRGIFTNQVEQYTIKELEKMI